MFGDKLKKFINKNQKENKEENVGNDKKKIENLVFFVVVLIITIVIINAIINGNKATIKQEKSRKSNKQLAMTEQEIGKEAENELSKDSSGQNLEKKLEEILAKMQGVDEVKVFINYSETSEVIAMYNENSKISNTEETDTSGGIRKIQETDLQKDIIYKEENGEKKPITQKVIQPKIEGAIITAKGANDTNVKTNIIQAVEAVTGLATHKIQVFEMK